MENTIKKDDLYRLYVSKNGQLRMVMQCFDDGFFDSINISDMTINGLVVSDDLLGCFTGSLYPQRYRNKVKFK